MAVSPSPQSSNPPPTPVTPTDAAPRSSISLVFAQGGSTCLLRPNAVVRGHVELKLIKSCHAVGIRLKLKAEESAIVLGQESNGDSLRQKFRQTVVTLFDTEIVVWGSSQDDNELANWKEIPAGDHSYPFALKVPNVNFPPCIPSLDGFSIRYVWTAQVEGPFEPSLSSEEVLCQFLPYVLAPKPIEWTYHDTIGAVLSKNSTHQLHKPLTGIALDIRMHQQIYIPGDPLYMATTLHNSSQNKIVGIDVILRRTIKGTFPTSFANLCHKSQVEITAKSVECKIRGGETGQVDILTTIPPMGKSFSIPTFESNFLKVYYELMCVVRVKRSVFAGGDTSYQCAIPIPIATHNVDNPMITGRTPRWTKSRMQPYFFDPASPGPVGDLPASMAVDVPVVATAPMTSSTTIMTNNNGALASSTVESLSGISSTTYASASSLLSLPGTSSSAMQEFLNSGPAELYRERTLKKSLTRSKSLKDIQPSRLDGSSWRAEREQLLSQSRETGSNDATSVNNSNKRSPPLGPKSRPSNEDRHGASPYNSQSGVDSSGNITYTPPPPSTSRSQKSVNLTPEQQADLARKASRRILPNQGQYTNEGVLASEHANTENRSQSQSQNQNQSQSQNQDELQISNGYGNSNSKAGNADGYSSNTTYPNSTSGNVATYLSNSSTSKIPPRRNASLSQKSHQHQQNGSNGAFVAEPENYEHVSRGGNNSNAYGSSAQYESNYSSKSGRSNNSSSDQGYHRTGQDQQQQQNGYPVYSSNPIPERVPYQHSLPARQQPPGVIPTSPPLSSAGVAGATQLERSSSRRDGMIVGDFLPPPPPSFNNKPSSGPLTAPTTMTMDDVGGHHRRSGSGSSANLPVNAAPIIVGLKSTQIPPWERVERIHYQDWFRPGPHQTGALQTFDVAGITLSQHQPVPIMKKILQRPMETVQSIEAEEHLR